MRTRIILFILIVFLCLSALGYLKVSSPKVDNAQPQVITSPTGAHPQSTPTPIIVMPAPPPEMLLQNDYQIFQTFNNCGPASLSMALSYFGIHKSQAELGMDLRPYQNPQGNNDDKSVSLSELAQEAEKFGLLAFVRPDGTIEMLKQFVAQGLPVVIETTLTTTDDIGHFRVVKGYNDTAQTIIQDDSMQGHNIAFSNTDITTMWKQYDFQYLILFPKDKQEFVRKILGKDVDEKIAWQEAADVNRAELDKNPDDVYARFNLSTALYYLGDYEGSVREFEAVQNKLPKRILWYQIEPIEAYFALGRYDKVFSLTDEILTTGNRAFSELYILRGRIYQKEGNLTAAKDEFEKAVYYNTNMKAAQDALRSVTNG